ncbi:MAG: class I tRNA ligase family protein, partial [Anaerolineae bacterium]|nr:class I tRNA ligase family protein [Anaerolineae bacterium]
RYYPTSVMETGYDIIFFWVARMIMMGLWFTEEIPFHTVYLHGLVRDAQGRKISKTLGNIIDPKGLMSRFGTDPLRFTLVTSGTPGNDVNLDENRIEGNWRFVNKIWQMANFITSNIETDLPAGLPPNDELDLPSRWILSRLNSLVQNTQRLFDNYLFGEPGRQIYDFLWNEFADWYIEISKHALYSGETVQKERALRVLVYVLDTCLRMLHPYMPFMTEEIWQYLPHEGETLMLARWPQADSARIDAEAEAKMNALMDMVRGVRNVRSEYNVDPGRRIHASIMPGSYGDEIRQYSYLFARLCHVEQIDVLNRSAAVPDNSATIVVNDATVYLPLAGLVDIEAECQRLSREHEKIQQQIQRSEKLLNNPNFVSRAAPEVVERERKTLADLQASATQIDERLTRLCSER